MTWSSSQTSKKIIIIFVKLENELEKRWYLQVRTRGWWKGCFIGGMASVVARFSSIAKNNEGMRGEANERLQKSTTKSKIKTKDCQFHSVRYFIFLIEMKYFNFGMFWRVISCTIIYNSNTISNQYNFKI